MIIQDEVVQKAGTQGIMVETVSLFDIGDTIIAGSDKITLHGKARFSYGRGFWDEFWGLSDKSEPIWVSVDEGDVIVQREITGSSVKFTPDEMHIGAVITTSQGTFTVTEKEKAVCIGLRGAFDHVLEVGETYDFLNAQGAGPKLLSVEYWPGGQLNYMGHWFSPHEIDVERNP